MKFDLFKEWIPSINDKQGYLFDGSRDSEVEHHYPSFMINRALSQYEDTVLLANEVNRFASTLDPKLQYDFLYYSVPKKKRFASWNKATTNKDISIIQEVYKMSVKKAEEISDLLDKEQMDSLEGYIFKGGRDKK